MLFTSSTRGQRYEAPNFDHFWDFDEPLDDLLNGLGVELRSTDTVLEIGCGIGRITRVLAARASHVMALDVSDEMLARARQHPPGLDPVRWLLGDGVSLARITDQSIDACVSVVVFQHLPDPAITLGYIREVGRVLAPNGWAALQVSNNPDIHRPRESLWLRLKALIGGAPKGQRHPWTSSARLRVAPCRWSAWTAPAV